MRAEIRNSDPEIRKNPETRIPNGFNSGFGLRNSFGIRISSFVIHYA